MKNKSKKVVIAIDGPSGVGKSTVSRLIAERFGYEYIDTGAMYRAVAVAAADKGLDLKSDPALLEFCRTIKIHFLENGTKIFLNNVDLSERIRTSEAGEQASRSSALPSVRSFLVGLQRDFARGSAGIGVVMEGRDIGTNVFKDAELKIYLDADEKVRATRRHGDFNSQRETSAAAATVAGVEGELAARDKRDRERKLSPLAMAEDAVLVDTTELTIDEVVEHIVQVAKEKGLV